MQALGYPAEGCSLSDLAAQPERALGALTVAGQFLIGDVDALVPKNIPPIPLTFAAADEHLERLRKLVQPSVIAVVSVSPAFLKTARGLLAPALGRRHEVLEFGISAEGRETRAGSRPGVRGFRRAPPDQAS